MNGSGLALFVLIWTLLTSSLSTGFAQTRETTRQVVDVVHLKNQKPIRGLILEENPSRGLSIAVSKQWLERENPDAYAKALESAEKAAIQARIQLRERLSQLNETKTGAIGFVISKELERIVMEIEKPPRDEYQFLVMQVKSATVTSRSIASLANKKIAAWSWHEKLAEVETRTPSSLESELKAQSIDTSVMPPSLSSRFYPVTESDDLWNIRISIVTHRLEKPIEFQGSGDVMVTVGGEQRQDITSLMGQMMQSQMNSLLQELANGGKRTSANNQVESKWIKASIAQAEKLKSSYFRATQVELDAQQGIANVESVFMTKLEQGNWVVVWKSTASQKSADQKQDDVERIKEDPQLKDLQKQLETLGGVSGSLDNAIRMGAATMRAQLLVNEAFQQYTERYLKMLNSPPVQVIGK